MSSVLETYGLVEENINESKVESETDKKSEDVGGTEILDASNEETDKDKGSESEEVEEAESSDSTDVQPKKKQPVKALKSLEDQLEEEKGFRTRIQRELKESKEQIQSFTELKSRFDELRGELRASKEPEEPELSYEDNPLGYLKNQIDGLREAVHGFTQYADNSVQISEHQKNVQILLNKADKSFNNYAKEHSDFGEAMTFLRENRLKQYGAMGYSDDESNQMLNNDTILILDRSYKGEQNPAEVVYQIAKINGFKSKNSSKEIIKKTVKGQAKNKTIGDSGSGAEKGESNMSLEDLAVLSDQEFDKYWDLKMRGRKTK